jgi:hypothetical protein
MNATLLSVLSRVYVVSGYILGTLFFVLGIFILVLGIIERTALLSLSGVMGITLGWIILAQLRRGSVKSK